MPSGGRHLLGAWRPHVLLKSRLRNAESAVIRPCFLKTHAVGAAGVTRVLGLDGSSSQKHTLQMSYVPVGAWSSVRYPQQWHG
jgi:hypothetical protein